MMEALTALGSVFFEPYLLFLIFMTTIIGIVIGVLPGLGATTGAALLLPFTLTMPPVHAIAVLATIYVSATFAGSITAILINTPGTSAAAATTFDGFPLAQKGSGRPSVRYSCDFIYLRRRCLSNCFMFCRAVVGESCI